MERIDNMALSTTDDELKLSVEKNAPEPQRSSIQRTAGCRVSASGAELRARDAILEATVRDSE